jgi:hypothetical protein
MNKKNLKSKADSLDLRNLPLTEYYETLPTATRIIISAPKDELLEDLSKLTGRTKETVRTWCLGINNPPQHIKVKIAKYFHTSPETLFPENV